MKNLKIVSLICLLSTVAPVVAAASKTIGDSRQAQEHTHSAAEDQAADALRKCLAKGVKKKDFKKAYLAKDGIDSVKNKCKAEIIELYLISIASADLILSRFQEVMSINKLGFPL